VNARRVAAVAVGVLLVGGCYSGEPKPGPTDGSSLRFDVKATIVLDDTGIHPDVTKGEVGDAITVTNRGTRDHGLTSESIETGTLRPGESTTVFLTAVATIDVHDRADPSHTAKIEVGAKR
jgi:hypothetical protein